MILTITTTVSLSIIDSIRLCNRGVYSLYGSYLIFKYITLDSKLTHNALTSCILRKTSYIIIEVYLILNTFSTTGTHLAFIIYKSLFRFRLTYISLVWSYAAETYATELETYDYQSQVFRMATKIPRV
jgi:hypothetical protein